MNIGVPVENGDYTSTLPPQMWGAVLLQFTGFKCPITVYRIFDAVAMMHHHYIFPSFPSFLPPGVRHTCSRCTQWI